MAWIHHVLAVIWLIGLPLTLLAQIRTHGPNLRGLLRWSADDALWLIQFFRQLCGKKVILPPVGRFNAGQKLNTLLTGIYYVGFSISGVLMFCMGGMLAPWYFHLALFFATLATVGGHLYLALINPGTRVAWRGIFTGWVPMAYVQHHHPLSLSGATHEHDAHPGRKTRHEELQLSREEMVIFVLAVLLAGAGLFFFRQTVSGILSPGDLSPRHHTGALTTSCAGCHANLRPIADAKCEQCHVDIGERRQQKLGYHGTLTGNCRTCHPEHGGQFRSLVPMFPGGKFDHDLAQYKLEGKHLDVACDRCHRRKPLSSAANAPGKAGVYYVGMKFSACTDCHKDVHLGVYPQGCESCHSTSTWKSTSATGQDADAANGEAAK